MPYALLLAIDIAFVIHAAKTGRFLPWGIIILLLPGIGVLIYIGAELAPEYLSSHKGRQARRQFVNTINPDGRYRALREQAEEVDTISNRVALAEECLARGRCDEALMLYEGTLAMPLGREPHYHVGKARALQGLNRPADAVQALEDLREIWPDYYNGEAHLLYAVVLEEAGRTQDALVEYEALSNSYPGVEPRVRRAQLLARTGRTEDAKAIADEVVRALGRAPAHVRQSQGQWMAEAKKVLGIRS